MKTDTAADLVLSDADRLVGSLLVGACVAALLNSEVRRYLTVDQAKVRTDKSLVTTPNLVFLKLWNFGASLFIISTLSMAVPQSPSSWLAALHRIGMWVISALFARNY